MNKGCGDLNQYRSKSLCARKDRNTGKDSKRLGIFLISIT